MPDPVAKHEYRVEVVTTNGRHIHNFSVKEVPSMVQAITAAKTSLDIVGEFGANQDLLCVSLTISRRVSYE